MKKLMIAAAIVCAAAISQAATCSWQVTKVYSGDTTTLNGGVAYFMTTAACADFSAFEGKGATAVLEALGSAYNYKPSVAGTYTVASTAPVSNSALGLTDGANYTGYLVIFDTETVTDASNFFITNTKDFQALSGTSNKNILFGSQESNSQAAGNWHAVAVPEPTSGLLLLLGVAGMALRRRRA